MSKSACMVARVAAGVDRISVVRSGAIPSSIGRGCCHPGRWRNEAADLLPETVTPRGLVRYCRLCDRAEKPHATCPSSLVTTSTAPTETALGWLGERRPPPTRSQAPRLWPALHLFRVLRTSRVRIWGRWNPASWLTSIRASSGESIQDEAALDRIRCDFE